MHNVSEYKYLTAATPSSGGEASTAVVPHHPQLLHCTHPRGRPQVISGILR